DLRKNALVAGTKRQALCSALPKHKANDFTAVQPTTQCIRPQAARARGNNQIALFFVPDQFQESSSDRWRDTARAFGRRARPRGGKWRGDGPNFKSFPPVFAPFNTSPNARPFLPPRLDLWRKSRRVPRPYVCDRAGPGTASGRHRISEPGNC